MKADVAQQRLLVDLASVDAELTRLTHRRANPPERQEHGELQAQQRKILGDVSALGLALEDLDVQVAKLDTEVTAVRQREDRDRSLLASGSVNPKELVDIQHELDTLERRQSSLEDSELELMERREELQAQQASAQASADKIAERIAEIERLQRAISIDTDAEENQIRQRRDGLSSSIDGALLEAYERQRRSGGPGAGLLQGNKCGACRIELDRGELSRISAAAADEVLRCPECSAILVRL
ncbi:MULTISPECIES: C4-type zinc ribbon domain-containing protein [unclassified Mycobacterium]|uniref:zinc ribbon domain-containing protein n=1 Tax=unclassified Mycobacterium TaxID=2642494 RepID=UPI000993D1E4|nr:MULTISPECIES: C4-type zinc ribbon domain-containing protein [unclassified Mycobacterium]